MSKFKVGDRVLIAGPSNIGSLSSKVLGYGSVATITSHAPHDKRAEYKLNDGIWFPCSSLKPAPQTPKTYTLTPYIKPETVTINGVEYIMTENENVA